MIAWDKYFSENSIRPNEQGEFFAVIHPKIWSGYWAIQHRPIIINKLFRWLGKHLHSKRIYWIGLSIYWVHGLKEYMIVNED